MTPLPELPPVRTIVVATDLSPASVPALETAARLAATKDAQLHVIHAVVEDVDPRLPQRGGDFRARLRQAAERELAALVARSCPAGLEPVVEARNGAPHEVLLACAHRAEAEVLVLGTCGRTSLPELGLGSVAEGLAAAAPIDLLLVRERGTGTDACAPPFRRPLLALEASPSAYRAAARAAEYLAAASQEHLEAISAYDLPLGFSRNPKSADEVAGRVRQLLEEDLEPARSALASRGVALSLSFRRGKPALAVLERAAEHGADVVFVGSPDRPRWSSMFLGATSRTLAHRLPGAIWLVRESSRENPLLAALADDLGLR